MVIKVDSKGRPISRWAKRVQVQDSSTFKLVGESGPEAVKAGPKIPMSCIACDRIWAGMEAPGIGPICECGSDGFIPVTLRPAIQKRIELEAKRRANEYIESVLDNMVISMANTGR